MVLVSQLVLRLKIVSIPFLAMGWIIHGKGEKSDIR